MLYQRSIRPRTRQERLNLKDKVALEKSRINQRVGHEARMHQANAPTHTSGLTSCESADAAGYITDANRFHSDTAGEEYLRRQADIERKKKIFENKRQQTAAREDEKYRQMQEQKAKDEEYWNQLRKDGIKAKKNQSNVAYDLVTLRYNESADGDEQKYQDDMVRYRAKLRAKALVEHGDGRFVYSCHEK